MSGFQSQMQQAPLGFFKPENLVNDSGFKDCSSAMLREFVVSGFFIAWHPFLLGSAGLFAAACVEQLLVREGAGHVKQGPLG